MNYRNKRLLEIVRESPCQMCGSLDGTVVAAHANSQIFGKGKGIKAHDWAIAALCVRCHYEIDQGKDMTKQERFEAWQSAHHKTIGWLFENGYLEVK